jgi:hypothetical protein
MSLYHSPRVVTDGLVLYLDAANKRSYPGSGTTWYDLSGKNNHATMINGVTFSSNSAKGSMFFDGDNDRVDINSLGTYSQYTIMYFLNRYGGNRMPFGATSDLFYHFGDNSWRYVHGGVGGEFYYPKTVSIPDNTWGNWAFSYNGQSVKVYRQTVYEGEQATTGTANFGVGIKLGYYSGGSAYTFSGLMSNIMIYNKALSQDQIKQNFNALKGRYGL